MHVRFEDEVPPAPVVGDLGGRSLRPEGATRRRRDWRRLPHRGCIPLAGIPPRERVERSHASCAAEALRYSSTSTCASLLSSSHTLNAVLSCTLDSSALRGQVHPGAAGRIPAIRLASESVNALDPPPPHPAARIATATMAAPRTAAELITRDRPTLRLGNSCSDWRRWRAASLPARRRSAPSSRTGVPGAHPRSERAGHPRRRRS